jgi:NAD(P)-dependent dehydrogenase (short-subunit alcohol dehydrogenase family)
MFADKIVLVTGGSFGIGSATAVAFAEAGAKVIIADCIEDPATLEQIRRGGGTGIFIQCDVSVESQVKALMEAIGREFGGLDYAFNNAGIEGEQAITEDCTVANFDRVINVNLRGVWLCMKYEIPMMLRRGKGSIVNNASIAGKVGFPGIPAYAASKHAVIGLTKTTALENVKRGIRVNAVCPGIIDTPMIDRFTGNDKAAAARFAALEPMGRAGMPDEVAAAVLWLCSDQSSFVTGTSLMVDGGWTAQ